MFHAARLRLLIDTQPDLLAIETISAVREARAIVEAVDGLPTIPAWVTFTCRDGTTTWAGDTIEEAVAAVVDEPVRHCGRGELHGSRRRCPSARADPPGHRLASRRIPERRPELGCSSEGVDGLRSRHSRARTSLIGSELGACYLGGCCGVGPSGIAALSDALDGGTQPRRPAEAGHRSAASRALAASASAWKSW